LSILEDIFHLVSDEVTVQLKRSLEKYTREIIRRAIKILIICMIGLTFVAVGFVFMLYGTATYLAQFMFSGLAFGLVGLIAALVGVILILLVRR
jgi:inner membrane protein involved in colicin E2 resistance